MNGNYNCPSSSNNFQIIIGFDLEKFRTYYRTCGRGELGTREEELVRENPDHLIIWEKDSQILGHAIWHESNVEEHKKNDPRDENDKKILKQLLEREIEFIELHELWLKEENRNKGYGKLFFEFFEE